MNKLCSSFDKKQLAPDVWLTDFERLSESLELLTDAYDLILYAKISIPPAKPIPTSFSAYSLFLFPSAEWSKRDKIDQLSKIRTAFSDFGDAIGNKRAAIWLSTGFNSSDPDIQRSKYFADLFKLNYNEGPFIVTSSRRPDVLLKRDEVIVIKLNQINADRIIKILNILEQDLRNDATIRKRALIYEEIKQRLLSVTDRYPEVAKELAKTAIGMIAK